MKVVFDTNVVISACFWRGAPFDCLSAWAAGEVDAFVSPDLLAEYFEVFEELSGRYRNRKPVMWSDALSKSAGMVYPIEQARKLADPDDEMVLACAITAEVDFLVTGDKQHLLKLREVENVRLISCAEFLVELG